jgi:hypothetical protein
VRGRRPTTADRPIPAHGVAAPLDQGPGPALPAPGLPEHGGLDRLTTHAPGWIFRLDADGNLHVTTPTGVTRTSRPPGLEWLEPYELDALPASFATLDPAPF